MEFVNQKNGKLSVHVSVFAEFSPHFQTPLLRHKQYMKALGSISWSDVFGNSQCFTLPLYAYIYCRYLTNPLYA